MLIMFNRIFLGEKERESEKERQRMCYWQVNV